MDFKIVETKEVEVCGVSREFEWTTEERYELEHIMWVEYNDNVPARICEGYDGEWYGICQNGKYMIARDKFDTTGDSLEKYVIPAGTYAAFTSDKGGYAGEELPKMHDLIFCVYRCHSPARRKLYN